MKKILFISAIALCAFSYQAKSQVSVHINIGRQPVWGPVGYDYVNYYYLPDLDVYYDVPHGLFVYYDFGRWNFAASLPASYGRYDLYHSYKVVLNDRNPWLRNTYYRSHYASYREHYQPVIRDSRDNRYFAEREHYEHNRHNDRGDYGRDNGRGSGGRNNGHGNGGDRKRENHGHHDRD